MQAPRQPDSLSLLQRFRQLWGRLFFWQTSTPSEETAPAPHPDQALVLSVTKPRTLSVWNQLRFVNYVLDTKERRQFWIATLVGILFFGIGSSLLIKPHLLAVPGTGGRLSEGLIGSPRLINPLYPSSDADVDLTKLVYSGLFRLDQNIQPTTDLAEKYQWLDNNRTLEVSLRQDARFHDGLPVTADDVLFTIQAAKNPAWRSPLFSTFKNVTLIRVDDNTIQFQTDTPNPNLPFALTVGILPAHIWEDVSESSARLADANLKPIGSGPYRFDSFTRDSKGSILSYHLRRFDEYYGQKPALDGWDFRFYPDHEQAKKALQNNQIDSLSFLPWNEIPSLKIGDHVEKQIDLPQSTTLFFNVTDPILRDIRVRQAFDLAIDRGELKTTVGDHATVLQGPFPFLGFHDASSTQGDIEQARTLMTTAGWIADETHPIRQQEKPKPAKKTTKVTKKTIATATPITDVEETATRLSLTLTVPDQADLLLVANFLKQRWSLLGADITIEQVKTAELRQRVAKNQNMQLVLWNLSLSPEQDISPFWHSDPNDDALNVSHFSSKALDTALDAVANASSSQARLAGQTLVSQVLRDQTPALFLLRPSYAYVLPKSLQGTTNMRIATPADRLTQTLAWYLKTQWKWQ